MNLLLPATFHGPAAAALQYLPALSAEQIARLLACMDHLQAVTPPPPKKTININNLGFSCHCLIVGAMVW